MSAFDGVSTADLRTWINQALRARQQQMVGPSSASSADGRRVAFDRAKGDLDAYIAELRREIETREAPAGSCGPIVIGF